MLACTSYGTLCHHTSNTDLINIQYSSMGLLFLKSLVHTVTGYNTIDVTTSHHNKSLNLEH